MNKSKSPARGIVKHKGEHAKACPFQARIGILGRRISLGYFATEQEASAARRAALKLAAALVPSLRSAESALRRLEGANRILARGVQEAAVSSILERKEQVPPPACPRLN